MIERIVSFCLKQRTMVAASLVILILAGVYAYLRLPIDAFPDVTNVQVEIVSTAPGLSPLEIERTVTHPIEISMRGLPSLVQMRSVTKFGISVIILVFNDATDIYFARQLVFQRLEEAAASIPEGVKAEMGPVTTAMGEIYQYTLEGFQLGPGADEVRRLTELRTLQDWVVAPLLKSIPGVSEVNSFGGYFKQYQVVADPVRLQKYGLSVGDVVEALRRNNRNIGGNVMARHEEEYIVRGVGLVENEEDISEIVLKAESGTPILIRDVARVRSGQAVRQGASVKDGKGEAVGGIIMMLRGANSREVVRKVEETVRGINAGNVLPPGVVLRPFYNRAEIIGRSVETVTLALALGALLVILILLFFLRSGRSALVVVLALPLSALLTFIVMKVLGLSANLMSLGGLAISVGMIIDATIIQVENVQRHLGEPSQAFKLDIVLKAVLEVRKPSIFGELIIALTFLPIVSLSGLEGKMFSPLAFTVAIALLASLLLSIFVVPVLCSYFLTRRPEKESLVIRLARRVYLPVLRLALRAKAAVLLATAALLAVALLLIPRLGTEFIPVMDEGAFDMDIQLLPGISLSKAVEVSTLVEKKLMEFPELETIVSRTGQTGVALEARGVDKTGYVGVLRPRREWVSARNREELAEKMRDSLAEVPGLLASFSQPIQCRIDELVAGTRAQLIVKLYGEDLAMLKDKAAEVAEVLSSIPGATDIVLERTSGQPYLTVKASRERMARFGLNVDDILETLETAVAGRPATKVFEGSRAFDVVVRFPEERRDSPEAIGRILVSTASGLRVPLDQVAQVDLEEGPVQISREDGQRRIGIELNVQGRDIGRFVQEAGRRLAAEVPLPVGTTLRWGGQFENQQRAMRTLMLLVPLVVLLILALLAFTFDSLRLAGLVILNLPFALIGGVFALFLSGQYLSVPASIGFIVLFGVAVLNGLVLVSYINQLVRDGMDPQEAVLAGGLRRLRPVLMTATITVFSLIPLLFASGPGSEIQKPLATVVIGGIITSTVLTLLVLPVLYRWFGGEKQG
jgi:cobalt-zinc-cadmium resistance protein CzcA